MSYTAISLDVPDRDKLIETINLPKNSTWEVLCDHMTINMGLPKAEHAPMLGKRAAMFVDAVGKIEGRVAAVRVFYCNIGGTEVKSTNKVAHITIAVNRGVNAKPVESNNIVSWEPLKADIVLRGTLCVY